MDLKDIEKYWIETADDALDSADKLFEQGKYVHSMFFLHLALEKMIKALYVNLNKQEAPFGHSLHVLISKINDVTPDEEQMKFFTMVSTFNIQARYNDYKKSFYKSCTREFSHKYLSAGKEAMQWLKSLIK